MNSDAFRKHGRIMIDFIADYWSSVRKRTPLPKVIPGFMREMIPEEPPQKPEDWQKIFDDIEKVVLDGNTHWHHPNFFAYFPTSCSYQSIMGDMLSGGLASIGFSWKSSPSMTELELAMTNWLARALGLPSEFLNSPDSPGIGTIQNTASDATFIAMIAARSRMVEKINSSSANDLPLSSMSRDGVEIGEVTAYRLHDPKIIANLIAYCSDQAHSSVEKAAMLASVRLRKLKTTRGGPLNNYYIDERVLRAAIDEDKRNGLTPFILVATVGTTPTCGVDPIERLAPICNQECIWVHVDSAYAENCNLSCLPSLQHLQLALGRRFRSLKLWFVMRNIGIEGLQLYQRKLIELAKRFEELVQNDELLELVVPRHLGLNSSNEMNELLHRRINEDRRLHLVPSKAENLYFLRLAVCSSLTTLSDIDVAHSIVHEFAEQILRESHSI